jgi:acyl carrier protein
MNMMNTEIVKSQVRQYVMDNFLMGQGAKIGDDESFMASHVIDSVGVLELIAFLEERFRIKVEDDEMIPDNLDSLNGVGRYLARKLHGAN